MVKVEVKHEKGHMVIEAVGHAGDSIICSAVSAILQTAVLGLQAISEQYPENIKVVDKL